MMYLSTMFGFLMRQASTWMVWLVNMMCDFGHYRIRMWFMRRCFMHLISSHGLLGPIFFEETVISVCCLSILFNTFVSHLFAIGLLLQTQWFMQDGARLHTANVVLDFLHDIFDLCHLKPISLSFHTWTELAPK
jgi:hypothetical protein